MKVRRSPAAFAVFLVGITDRGFADDPRPMLADLTALEPEKADPAARVIGQALAIAFFRRLGVF